MLLVGDFIPQRLSVRLPDEFSCQTVLANLEGPICADGLPVSGKVGVCLHTTPSDDVFNSIRTFAFSLANNHLMDFRDEGLHQTRQMLETSKIAYAGAGENDDEARRPMMLEENGIRIAVICCSEHQFGMATHDSAGVAAMGVWLYDAIRTVKARGTVDRVIVSCHAASEFCPWPSPQLREFYHSLIDAGADVIHGHHSHVPQGWEVYKGKPIFFGLGNFVVDTAMWAGNPNQLWSLMVELQFSTEGDTFKVVPHGVSSDESRVSVRPADNEASLNDYLKAVNMPLLADTEVPLESIWQEASVRLYHRIYAQGLRAPGTVKRRLSMRDRLRKAYFSLRDLGYALCGREWSTPKSAFYAKCLYNYFNCPSHQQTISTALGVLTGTIPDRRTAESRRLAEQVGL